MPLEARSWRVWGPLRLRKLCLAEADGRGEEGEDEIEMGSLGLPELLMLASMVLLNS